MAAGDEEEEDEEGFPGSPYANWSPEDEVERRGRGAQDAGDGGAVAHREADLHVDALRRPPVHVGGAPEEPQRSPRGTPEELHRTLLYAPLPSVPSGVGHASHPMTFTSDNDLKPRITGLTPSEKSPLSTSRTHRISTKET
ncbi:hypothetical protein EYF80_048247 [Liparis tanakae]|uniref:Uncharacterized protein n=1 Tax=Liparis tanakae TaxID=230148 RepID=A0A4Z2FKA6_9TELE|nr:hypothetical protein EYF80_048247 [Liparis tanakae]